MPYCKKCGNPVEDGNAFCSKCGEPVERSEGAAVPTQVQPSVSYTPVPTAVPDYTAPAADPLQKCLDKFHRRLGYEKTAYLVIAILQSVAAVFMLIAGFAIISVGAFANNQFDRNSYYNSGYGYTSASHTEAADIWDDYYFDDYDDYYDHFDHDDYYDYDHDYDYGINDEVIAQAVFSMLGGVYLVIGFFYLAGAIINFVQVGRISKFRNELYTDCTGAMRFCRSIGVIVLGVFFGFIPMIFHIVNRVFVIDHEEPLEEIRSRQEANSIRLN